jgi:hypothetical protein
MLIEYCFRGGYSLLVLNWFNKVLFGAVAGIYRLVFHIDKEQARLMVESLATSKLKPKKKEGA